MPTGVCIVEFDVINPADGKRVQAYAVMGESHLRSAIANCAAAQDSWRRQSLSDRAVPMREISALLRRRAPELARLMTLEMGKPYKQGISEVQKCSWACDYYATNAEAFLAPVPVETGVRKSFVSFQPLGVVLAVMPWNYPYWQVFRFAAPTLMAGNGCLLKHSPNVTGCALSIEGLFHEAGFPEHLFRTLVIDTDQTAGVIRDPHVKAVSLTGSVAAGRSVATQAGAVLKKCVLELGGSDAYVVLHDADLDVAVAACAAGRFVNSGQSCIAAKRFIVVASVFDAFQQKMISRIDAERMGDPRSETTTIGPMARADLRDKLHEQVSKSIERGAKCLRGGKPADGPGWYYPPTLLSEVKPGMPAYSEELFGPVAVIIKAENEADAVSIANDSEYGLGGAVFTQDLARGERLATSELHSGAVFVNQQLASDPRMPFGGIKNSGYGRELGPFGIREFVNIKSVSIR